MKFKIHQLWSRLLVFGDVGVLLTRLTKPLKVRLGRLGRLLALRCMYLAIQLSLHRKARPNVQSLELRPGNITLTYAGKTCQLHIATADFCQLKSFLSESL